MKTEMPNELVRFIVGAMASLLAAFVIIIIGGHLISSAHAGTNCNRNDVRVDGRDGADAFSFPARLDFGEEGNIGLSESDCTTDRFQEAQKSWRRSAGVAAAMDAYGEQPGLNLTLNYANIGLEDDVNTAGVVIGYRHDFANPGWIHSITGKLGAAGDTTWDEQGVSAGVTLSFGTF